MLSSNLDELQLLVSAAIQWRAAGAAITPDPVLLTQINATIHDKPVVLAWNEELGEWEITAI